jgi:hypothetical protein
VVFIVFNCLRGEVVFRNVDIRGIVDHQLFKSFLCRFATLSENEFKELFFLFPIEQHKNDYSDWC